MGSLPEWKVKAQVCLDIQEKSLRKEWKLPENILAKYKAGDVFGALRETSILSEEELKMTEQDAASLLKKYKSGEWTVTQVTTAFLKRSTIGQQLLNFATELLPDEALATARMLDEHFSRTGELYGPLHGIPTSVKEHISLAGKITHAGFVSMIDNVPTDDALIIKILKEAGAVIHARTNLPQSIMHLDSTNNITGTTLNPYNLKLSPGGSSGGEGSSVGFKCSVLGVGTDIGGSVRVPAAFNNCFGLRPTALRNPTLGLAGINAGQESIRGILGPLGQTIDDISLFQQAVLDTKPWDIETSLVPLPWKEEKLGKITVAIMRDDGLVRPHPPVLRALETAAEKIRAAGINVVEWEPFDHARGWDIVSKLYFPDGGARYRREFEKTGEPELPLTTHALKFSRAEPLTVSENWELNYAREAYRREYHALMKERKVDVILCPAYVGAGVLLGEPKYWNYSAIWNILDQPAISFPSGLKVDKSIDTFPSDYKPRSEVDEAEWKAYNPELFDGFPIALQLAGKHHQDEVVVEACRMVVDALKA